MQQIEIKSSKIRPAIIIIVAAALVVSAGVYYFGIYKISQQSLLPEPANPSLVSKIDFSLTLPADFQEQYTPNAKAFAVKPPTQEQLQQALDPKNKDVIKYRFVDSLIVESKTLSGLTIDGYVNYLKNSFAQGAESGKLVSSTSDTINSKQAYFMEQEEIIKDFNVKKLVAIIDGNHNGDITEIWILTYTTSADNWTNTKDSFYESAGSFEIK